MSARFSIRDRGIFAELFPLFPLSAMTAEPESELLSKVEEQLFECVTGKRSWKELRLPDLDPAKTLRGAKKVKLVALDEDDLICPVCLHLPEGDVRMCPNGHSFCVSCIRGASPTCPCCKVKLCNQVKSLLHRKIVSSLITGCSFGCGAVIPFGHQESHKWECNLSTKKVCPFCSEAVIFKDLLRHLEASHKNERRSQKEFARLSLASWAVRNEVVWMLGKWSKLHDDTAMFLFAAKWNRMTTQMHLTLSLWNPNPDFQAPSLNVTVASVASYTIPGDTVLYIQSWRDRYVHNADWRKLKDGQRGRSTLSFVFPLEEVVAEMKKTANQEGDQKHHLCISVDIV